MATNREPALYSWAALNHPDSIRLLTLHPALSSADDIVISVREARLSMSSEYKAVSYCWATEDGDDSKDRTLTCDGALIFITRNCEAALRRIRNDQDRTIWLDAIFINQASDSERSHQAGLMGSIYKNASGVLVYLGEPQADVDEETGLQTSEIFLNFLFIFCQEVGDRKSQGLDIKSSSRYQEFIRKVQAARGADRLRPSSLIRGLRDVSSRRWWKRIWIIQEAVLAMKKGVTVLWGSMEALYSDFAFFYTATFSSTKHIRDAMRLWDVYSHLGIITICSIILGQGDERSANILEALKYASRLQASDPRDKVYGLLGIVDPNGDVLTSPDYTKIKNRNLQSRIPASSSKYKDSRSSLLPAKPPSVTLRFMGCRLESCCRSSPISLPRTYVRCCFFGIFMRYLR